MKPFRTIAFLIISFSLLPLAAMAQLSERKILGEFNGIEVSYQLEILGTKNRKKGDRTEYRMIAFAVNKNTQTLYCDNSTIVSVSPANSPSFTKTASVGGRSTGMRTINNQGIFEFLAGSELQSTVKFRVDEDSDPVIGFEPGCQYRGIESFVLMATPMLVNGRWQQENQYDSFSLIMQDSTISMQTVQGNIEWKATASDPGVFIRELIAPDPAGAKVYISRLQVRGPDTILYTNSEGVVLFWRKR